MRSRRSSRPSSGRRYRSGSRIRWHRRALAGAGVRAGRAGREDRAALRGDRRRRCSASEGTSLVVEELLRMMIPHVTSRSAMRFDMQRPECDTAMESLWDYLDAELAPGAARIVG